MTSSFLIAGCGYVGSKLAELLLANGDTVTGMRRHWRVAPAEGLVAVANDVTDPSAFQALPLGTPSHIVYAVAADGFSDEAYQHAYVDGLAHTLAFARSCGPSLRRFLFVSSTGVYGPGQGEWVDEATPLAEGGPFATQRLVEAERLLAASGLPTIAVRLGGIYGPGRQSLFDDVVRGTARLTGTPVWTNRIHLEDAARILMFLAQLGAPGPAYVAVDDEPALRDDVVAWLAHELGEEIPATLGSDVGLPQRGNRRCRNARLKAAGYRFVYPTFREGFRAILRAQCN